MKYSLRTPLSRARGLGSAKHGVGHFIQQRVTAIFLAFLLPWFGLSIILATDGSFLSVQSWMRQPWNAAFTAFLILTGLYHMRLGLQVVIEDYISGPVPRSVSLLANTAIPAILAIIAMLCIAKVFVGA
ncbi:succinate dehydrogenase, hydrophobic membrane anchor protein [Candidatus Phycosocius spiralis]|uniref:Succinate dehydrogenase hydrophobic membrane anchor subunit n=1 Tax=Candidatus Phycosocius spiralis TaxID=2815099 RepID=A0ABQ4PX44_9PROT|nr:succinate dehydrogenase, hydrophobic membrane anchor protein [Candidatus Phycosocius spiralis]GIU67224.1 succinate dehydrogenase, hydrophobic membrane anchor protein [Candidatus Phycosocius spiralis]